MSKEAQNIEWKETWHNSYLKWICGFANAQGGIFTIEMVKIINSDYQELNAVSKSTSTRDLSNLVDIGLIKVKGSGKRDIHYVLNHKNLK